jgi:hypothetical protein
MPVDIGDGIAAKIEYLSRATGSVTATGKADLAILAQARANVEYVKK